MRQTQKTLRTLNIHAFACNALHTTLIQIVDKLAICGNIVVLNEKKNCENCIKKFCIVSGAVNDDNELVLPWDIK